MVNNDMNTRIKITIPESAGPDEMAELYTFYDRIIKPAYAPITENNLLPKVIRATPTLLESLAFIYGQFLGNDAAVLNEHLKIFEYTNNTRFIPPEYAYPQPTIFYSPITPSGTTQILVPAQGRFMFLHDVYALQAKQMYASLSPIGKARMGDGFFNMFSYPKVLEAKALSNVRFEAIDDTKAIHELKAAFVQKAVLSSKYIVNLNRVSLTLTALSSITFTSKILASNDKKEALKNETPPFALGIAGSIFGSTVGSLSSSLVCGPAAPKCAVANIIFSSIAGGEIGLQIGQFLTGNQINPLDIKSTNTITSTSFNNKLVCNNTTFHSGATIGKCTIDNSLKLPAGTQKATNLPDHVDVYLGMQKNLEILRGNPVSQEILPASPDTRLERMQNNLALLQKSSPSLTSDALTQTTSTTAQVMNNLRALNDSHHNMNQCLATGRCDNFSQFTNASRTTHYTPSAAKAAEYTTFVGNYINMNFCEAPSLKNNFSMWKQNGRDGTGKHCDIFGNCGSSNSNNCRSGGSSDRCSISKK